MTKVPANSKNKPKITMQMVPTWMRNLDDWTNQPQAIVNQPLPWLRLQAPLHEQGWPPMLKPPQNT